MITPKLLANHILLVFLAILDTHNASIRRHIFQKKMSINIVNCDNLLPRHALHVFKLITLYIQDISNSRFNLKFDGSVRNIITQKAQTYYKVNH